ncbi:TIGR01459 family HAD-type hydrolase [Roseobacteraceae bacterium S113]
MTERLDSLGDLASRYDAIVFDQWGVLHNGSAPYPGAITCLTELNARGITTAVLSNSGKRAAPNAARIADMGFDAGAFARVMTSGEALWQDIAAGAVPERAFLPMTRAAGDAEAWSDGLDITLTDTLENAEAILLMGLPDGADLSQFRELLDAARARNLPLYCTNPDRQSPRAGGLVTSPGTLAFAYRDAGGQVRFYGKPHRPIFDALQSALGAKRLLMVGDSLEHDIAGAQTAGWDSLLIQGGLYSEAFAAAPAGAVLSELVAKTGCLPPTYRMDLLT